MKKILVPTRSGSDWQRLLAKPKLHWKRSASAMTAAACWEAAAPNLPEEISRLLDSVQQAELWALDLVCAIPEWEVALEGGETTSNTDVLALCRNDHGLTVLGVEAKVLEAFGPLVAEKRTGASPGQRKRLDYLHNLLGVEQFDDSIRYQFLHRTASAVLTARQFHAASAVMLVHAFGTPKERRQDFEAFAKAMSAEALTGDLYKASRFDAPTLYLAWCDGDARFLEIELPPCAEYASV